MLLRMGRGWLGCGLGRGRGGGLISRGGAPVEHGRLVAEEGEARTDAAGGVVDDAVLASAWMAMSG